MLKLAVLEDDPRLLKGVIYIIDKHKLGEPIAFATNSEEFIQQVEERKPDALILDIDLGEGSMNGVEVANYFNLPVFFITGHKQTFHTKIETLNINKDVPVFDISKPLIEENFVKLFVKFDRLIRAYQLEKQKDFEVTTLIEGKISVEFDDIVYVEAISAEESKSNNKKIQLSSREEPHVVSHKSMKSFFEMGLSKEKFIQTSQSMIVNKAYINFKEIKRGDSEYIIRFGVNEKVRIKTIYLTESFWSNLKK